MALAVGTTDEVARTIFRQIASDSIRHAEIISFLLSLTKSDSKRNPERKMIREEIAQIEAMIRGEESATEEPINIKGILSSSEALAKINRHRRGEAQDTLEWTAFNKQIKGQCLKSKPDFLP